MRDYKTFQELKRVLSRYKKILRRKFYVKQIGIFGSYARGEQKRTSDVDILVEFSNRMYMLL